MLTQAHLPEKKQDTTEWSERRRSRRYPLTLELRYMAVSNAVLRTGHGVTLDISSKSILFRPDAELVADTRMELSVGWPAAHAGEPLRLVLYGSVLRCDMRGAMALIERHRLVPGVADGASGAAPEWEKILERYRCQLLSLGRKV